VQAVVAVVALLALTGVVIFLAVAWRAGNEGGQAVAELLHMTLDEYRAELRAGRTLESLAAERGIGQQQITDAFLEAPTNKWLSRHKPWRE